MPIELDGPEIFGLHKVFKRLSVLTVTVVAAAFFAWSGLARAGVPADANVPVAPADPNAPPAIGERQNLTDANDPNSSAPVPERVEFNRKCAYILGQVVTEDGLVDYRQLKYKRVHMFALLSELQTLDRAQYESWTKAEQMAFWINAYNIEKLWLIMNNFPIESTRWDRLFKWGPHDIRHIEKNVGGIDIQKFIIMDEEYTFRAIDRRLRTDFDDPRVFLALSWASLGGPPLRPGPYYGYKLDAQLDEQVRRYLSSPRAFHIDRDKKKVELSYLFNPNMYGKTFAGKYSTDRKFKDHPADVRAVLNFVSGCVSDYDRTFLETESYSIEDITYDWTINDVSQAHQ